MAGETTITFTAKDRDTDAIVGTPFNVVAAAVVYGSDYEDEQWNQESIRTLDGNKHVYNTPGITVSSGNIIFKGVEYSNGRGFYEWLVETLVFQKNKMDINLNGESIDLGAGLGVNLSDVDYPKADVKGVFARKAPNVWTINLPFEWKR